MSKFSELRGLIEKSLNANPESWRSFFHKYNCDAESSHPEKEIVRAYGMYGDEVAIDVNKMLSSSFASFLGNDGLTSEESLAKVKDTSDKLREWLESIGTSDSDVPTDSKSDEDSEDNRSAIFLFVGVVVVCVVAFIVVRKIKK
ncbi:MAG: hypothetical protein MJ198_05125 [Bacteroidales bacterium]|nr:hypothetical protein [Bacteroidales bacterium]